MILLDSDLDAAEITQRIEELDTQEGLELVKDAIDSNATELARLLASADAFNMTTT